LGVAIAAIYYASGATQTTPRSVLAHAALPLTACAAALATSYREWLSGLTAANACESAGYLLAFLYANTWYYRLATHSWPYRGGEFPNLMTLEDNLLMAAAGLGFLALCVAHVAVLSKLKQRGPSNEGGEARPREFHREALAL
jgi:hypothetical protein